MQFRYVNSCKQIKPKNWCFAVHIITVFLQNNDDMQHTRSEFMWFFEGKNTHSHVGCWEMGMHIKCMLNFKTESSINCNMWIHKIDDVKYSNELSLDDKKWIHIAGNLNWLLSFFSLFVGSILNGVYVSVFRLNLTAIFIRFARITNRCTGKLCTNTINNQKQQKQTLHNY